MSDETPTQALRRELGNRAETAFGMELLWYIERLEETIDPDWLDIAVMRINEQRWRLPRTLLILASRRAEAHLKGAGRRGHISRAFREMLKRQAMNLMDGLIASGMQANDAAAHTAEALYNIHNVRAYNDATIRRYYNKYRKTELSSALAHVETIAHNEAPDFKERLWEELDKLPRLARGSYRG